MSYDKDGIAEGFDYSEVSLNSITNVSFIVRSIDEITDKASSFTIMCEANISANCYYEDYDNAPWDSENKEYAYVETVGIREEHHARFGCRIELNREEKEVNIIPFTIILGGDTRKGRYEIEEKSTSHYEQEIHDADREAAGLIPLGSYDSLMVDSIQDSKMSQQIIKRFEEIDVLHQTFEDFSIAYDSLLGKLCEKDNAKKIISLISIKLEAVSDFPGVVDEEKIDDEEIEKIRQWANLKFENVSKVADEHRLPDTLNYGDSILIKGVDDAEMILSIDEIMINPSEGEEELIDVTLSVGEKTVARGFVKLIVGYIDLDEDGGVADGLADSIEYNYQQIIKEIDKFISEQKSKLTKKLKLSKLLKRLFDHVSRPSP